MLSVKINFSNIKKWILITNYFHEIRANIVSKIIKIVQKQNLRPILPIKIEAKTLNEIFILNEIWMN